MIYYFLFLAVLTIETSMLISSLQSLFIEENASSSIKSLSFKRFNQYPVSLASLRAIDILLMKSAWLWACSLSFTNAPIAVPLFKSCLLKTYSLWLSARNLYVLTIRKAKAYDLSCMILPRCMAKQIYNIFPFSIFNFPFKTLSHVFHTAFTNDNVKRNKMNFSYLQA